MQTAGHPHPQPLDQDLEVSTPPSDAQSTGYGMWLGAPVQFVSLGAMTDDERLAFYAETRLRMYVRAGRGIALQPRDGIELLALIHAQ
jgi:hypothetical protein